MIRIRGWGLLLVICAGLLLAYSWSRLGPEKARISVERYEAWSGKNPTALLGPATQFFFQQRKLAGSGDITLPAVPANSGVKSWAVQADTTLRVELEGAAEGKAVVLRYVPIVRTATGMYYVCVSAASEQLVGRVCQPEELRSEAGIPAQLEANATIIANLPAVLSASGTELAAGTAVGSVVVVPPNAAELEQCGFQCVKPQSCATPRPLACGRLVEDDNNRRFDMAATPTDVRGSSFVNRAAADNACAQALGVGYRVVAASSLWGAIKLSGGREYWVHNDSGAQINCWANGGS
jgi:hypothetical protein